MCVCARVCVCGCLCLSTYVFAPVLPSTYTDHDVAVPVVRNLQRLLASCFVFLVTEPEAHRLT